MALVACPECSRVISEEALSCPECGYAVPQRPEPEWSPGHLLVSVLLIGLAAWLWFSFIPERDIRNYATQLISETDPSLVGLLKTALRLHRDESSGKVLLSPEGVKLARIVTGVIAVIGLAFFLDARRRRKDLVDCEDCDRVRVARKTTLGFRCLTCNSARNDLSRGRRNRKLAIGTLASIPIIVVGGFFLMQGSSEGSSSRSKSSAQNPTRTGSSSTGARKNRSRTAFSVAAMGVSEQAFAANDDARGGASKPELYVKVYIDGTAVYTTGFRQDQFVYRLESRRWLKLNPSSTVDVHLYDKDAFSDDRLATWRLNTKALIGSRLNEHRIGDDDAWVSLSVR